MTNITPDQSRWNIDQGRARTREASISARKIPILEAMLAGVDQVQIVRVSRAPSDAPARAFALEAHGSQRYGEHPYIFHLDTVADIVRKHTSDPAVIAAAFLHDVLEDVPSVKAETITRDFGARTSQIVQALTKSKLGFDLATYLKGIRAAGPDAVLVKLADRLANMTTSLVIERNAYHSGVYLNQYATFRAALHRPGEHEALWAALDRLAQIKC